MLTEDRGRLVARMLLGSWKAVPPPPDFSLEELSAIAPILFRQGSSGLAWARIRGTSLAETPQGSLLRDGFRHHTLRVRLLENQLAALLPLLRSRGVDPILGKGWAMGRLYPDPGRRPYGDLDFLIASDQLGEARKALEDQVGDRPAVEMHTSFNELEDRSPSELWERSQVKELGEVPVRVFSPEDHLRLLTLHGLEHGLCRPLWLVDVALFLDELPQGFDWDRCTRGKDWLSQGVRCSLGLAQELLGVELATAGVPDKWREPPLPAWLLPAALKAFGASAHYSDEPHPVSLLLRPRRLLRVARLRWANPIEATFRRRAPWDDSPRLPHQISDYLRRGLGLVLPAPRG